MSVKKPLWDRLAKILARLAKERAHGQVVLIFEHGQVKRVAINRNYLPDEVPDVHVNAGLPGDQG